jgi:O-antigen ligase
MLLTSTSISLLLVRRPLKLQESYRYNNFSTFLYFSIITFLLYIIGTLYGILSNKIEWGSTTHNLAAFLFYTLILFTLLFKIKFEKGDSEKLLKIIVTTVGIQFILFSVLFMFGQSSFLGIDLFFELRFSGFSINPNQLAFLCVPVPFLAFHFLKQEKKCLNKIWFLSVLTAALFTGLITLSDALLISWIVAMIYLFANYVFNDFRHFSQKKRILRLSIFLFIVIFFISAIAYVIQFASYIYGDNSSNSQGSDRFLYWENALKVWSYSPLFGFGPGSYSGGIPFGGEEAHNTILDWLVSVGIFGAVYFLFLMIKKIAWLQASKKPLFVAVLVALGIFSLFHLTTRHFLFWAMFLFL